MHGRAAKGDDVLFVGEQVHDGVLEGQQQHTGEDGVDDAHAQRDPQALLHAVELARAEVLAHEGGGRHAEAHDGQDVEAVHLHIGREPGHGGGTVAVDAGLHQNVGQRDDHILDAGGQAHLDDADGHFAVHPDLSGRHTVVVLDPHQKAQRQHTGNQLADVGGDGRTGHTHPQPRDEHEVEEDVRARCDAQIEQRPLGVARRIQDARRHVVHDAEQHTAEVDLHIGHRVLQHLRRGIHGREQGTADEDAADGQDEAQKHGQRQCGVHGPLRILAVLRAKILRHHDARTHCDALTEADEQKDGRAAGADGCQRIAAHKVADDDGVGGVVQLLKQVAQDQRHRKQQDALPDAALRHQTGLFLLRFQNGCCHDVPPEVSCFI